MNKELPVPENEIERIQALKDYCILDTELEAKFDRLTEVASLACNVPISLISLIDENRQWFKSKKGINVNETSRELAFCQYTIMDSQLLEVEDAREDDRFSDSILVTQDPHIVFYAGVPLIDSNGFALGTLCVIDNKPNKLSDKQIKILKLLSDEVLTLILERRKLKELENFENIFKVSNDLICIAGTDGFFKKINPAFSNVLGWEENFLLNTSFFEIVHPDDLEETNNEINKLASGENTINFVHRLRHSDNSYKIIQWVATPEPETGHLFAIGRDITDIKNKENLIFKSESRFRSFFENSQGLMCTHDFEGNFITVNKAGADLIGYSIVELLNMSLFDLVPKENYPRLNSYLLDIQNSGFGKGLMTTICKDGSERSWLYNNILEKSDDGTSYIIGNSIDITERIQLEKDLLSTKNLLEQTNKVAFIGGWEMIPAENSIKWSSVTKEIHEVNGDYSPDLETAILFYKEGESRNRIIEAVNLGINEGKDWDLDLLIVTANGKDKWVKAIGSCDFVNDQCIRVYGTIQDIDEQKRTKLALEASENKYRAFFEISPMGIAVNRYSDGKFIDGNQALYNLIGYTEEEYRQLSHWDVTPEKYDDQEAFHKESLNNTGRYGPYEKEYIHKDGHSIPVLLNGNKFIGMNGVESVYSVIQDISERKNAEKAIALERSRLQAFVENAPASVAMFDTEIRYVATSNRWKEEYKIESKDIIGLSHYEVFPNVSQHWKDIHTRCLAGAIEKEDEDVWRPEGWEVDQYLKWEVRPWYLFDGSVGGIMMFTQDVTQSCLQRDELKNAKIMAEQASVAKSEFLANMSHEIRTPLNGIIGFTDLVMKTNMNETQKQYISIVNQSGNALLSIINDILDFSKIEAGKLELDLVKCDLYETGSQAADIITYQAQSKGLEILLNIAPTIPRFIFADDLRLKQVLVNLLGNAVKFTDFGEIELKIETFGKAENGKTKYRFEVRDTGIGIKPDKLEKIFEAFSQEDGSTTKKYGGTGLGLTISNKLLDLMGSKLNLKSNYGKGSTFYFDLELDSEEGDPISWGNIDKIKKVLIVDDNQNNRLILKQMFLLKNIKSDEAKNGIEALNSLSNGEKYDVIIMDYHMPIMDGIETIRKIRDNFDESVMPVILLYSSSDDEKIIKACEELKVNHRLVKPIKIQDMYNALSRMHKIENVKENVKPVSASNAEFAPIRVLIAEDNAVNMLLAKTLISRIAPNSIIQEAINGEEAVILCEGKMPDMILMDVQMPEMNGYEATDRIRKMNHGDVPIIALTAGNVKGEKEKCLAAGMDDFISKPVIEETLAQMFNKWINHEADKSSTADEADMRKMHFNPEKIRQFIGNDPVVFRQMLSLTTQELITSSDKLSNHLIDKSLKSLQETAHKLYGTAVTSGLEELGRISKIIEHLPEYDEDVVNKLVSEAIAEIELLLKIIEKE